MLEGIEVRPMSRLLFRKDVERIWQGLQIKGKFPIIQILEYIMPEMFSDNYTFDVRDKDEMGKYHGATGVNYIYLREDVYDGACNDNGRDRFTAAHELGHYIYHREFVNSLHRQQGNKNHKIYCDSEWQANTFASELLMPPDLFLQCSCIAEVQEKLGVSYEAVVTRNNILLKDCLTTKRLC